MRIKMDARMSTHTRHVPDPHPHQSPKQAVQAARRWLVGRTGIPRNEGSRGQAEVHLNANAARQARRCQYLLVVFAPLICCPFSPAGRRAPAFSYPERIMVSWYHDVMTRQTTVRLPDALADQAEAVARVQGVSVNALIVDSLASEIERVRADQEFTSRARKLLERDKELLDRLAR